MDYLQDISFCQKTISKVKTISKADTNIRKTVKKSSKTRYWSATVKTGYVDLGRPLTYNQAVKEVSLGHNVFTVTQSEAKAIARAAGGSSGANNKPLYPEIDKGKMFTRGYYFHYHPSNRNGGHVFFLY